MPGHFHIQALSGRPIHHQHKDAPYGHEHDGRRRYARSEQSIIKERYFYLSRVYKYKPNAEKGSQSFVEWYTKMGGPYTPDMLTEE